MGSKRVVWLGHIPKFCESPMCSKPITDEFFDMATQMGPWACLCRSCAFNGIGIGLTGEGKGQRYVRDGERFVKRETEVKLNER